MSRSSTYKSGKSVQTNPTTSLYTLVPTIGAALIIVFATNKTLIGKLLSTKSFLWLGLISYSAYLWHQPLFAFARHRSLEEPSQVLMATLAVITLPLAYLTWRFVERPFRNKHTFSRSGIFKLAAIFSLLFICIGIIGHITNGFPNRSNFKQFASLEYSTDKLGYLDCKKSFASSNGQDINYCHTSSRGPIDAVVIGDSHADDKFFGIEKNDTQRNWGLMGNSSCPPVLGITVETDAKECRAKLQSIIDQVSNDKSIKTVVLAFYGHYFLDTPYAADHIQRKVGPETVKISSEKHKDLSKGELFYRGLGQAIEQLVNAKKEVVLLIDIPELPFFPLDCLKGKPNCVVPIKDVVFRQQEHRAMIAKLTMQFPTLKVFDPTSIFCQENECSYRSDGTVLYRDSHHLTILGSDLYGSVFIDWLNKH